MLKYFKIHRIHVECGKHILALLIAGGAVLLASCGRSTSESSNHDTMVTQEGDSLFVVESKNGVKSYRFRTPKMISYDLAREPYTVYPDGVFVETFRDSTQEIESTLVANYAINYKNNKRSLWEAIGNVVVTGVDGRTLYTEQLFWDEGTERIYNNVDSKMVQEDRVSVGEGFDSDQTLKHWEFHYTKSRLTVTRPSEDGSSTADGERQSPPGDDVPEVRNQHSAPTVNTIGGAIKPAATSDISESKPKPKDTHMTIQPTDSLDLMLGKAPASTSQYR